jgi:ubiquinone/menaquinone biosynthesis C-methylase UbiE
MIERLVIGQCFPRIEQEHLKRYEFATGYVAGKDVLDIACGSGYGSAMLADSGAKSVTGVDLSPEAVESATANFGRGNVRFAVGDVQRLTDIPDASFDLIASFETIEHVPDDRAYVDETARVLRPGGMLLVSTPDRRLGSIGPRLRKVPSNPFHVREYTRKELIDLLSRRFEIVEEFGQNFANPILCLLPIQAAIKAAAYALRNFGGQRVSNALYYGGTGPTVRSARNRWGIAGYWVMLCRRPAAS